MKTPGQTLYWQIAGLYLALLLLFATISMALTVGQLDGFFGEVEQRLNRGLASRLLQELAPVYKVDGVDGVSRAVKRISGVNPSIDVYWLKESGAIAASFTGKPPVRDQIDVRPIHEFLKRDATPPIRGIDPSTKAGEKVFSAARVAQDLGGGYLYVVLPGMPFESTVHMVGTSYIIRGAAGVLVAVLLTALAAGLGLFFVLTRRFERLTQTVRRFQQGAFSERAVIEPHDQIGRLAATFNDMAATIEMQFEALRQTDEARRSFANNISHDFRTPLTALRGFADRLIHAEERLTPEERRRHLAAILKSAAQLEHLADQLATMVQLDGSNDHALKLETFSIAELTQDSVIKFRVLAERKGVSLSLSDPEKTPAVVGDIAMIERVLSNLIDNGINSTPAGGRVTISLPVEASRVVVRIEDTGSGIAAEDLQLIKQRFYRTAASKISNTNGTGLGLAIVEEILSKHGSTLSIESRLTTGTLVSFSLVAA